LRSQLEAPHAYRPFDPAEQRSHPRLWSDPSARRHAETIAAELDAADRLAEGGQIDFLFLRIEALDLLTHAHFGRIAESGQDDGQSPLFDAYRYIDARLAGLSARLDDDDWLVVLSDHGIRTSMQHEEDAIFFISGPGVRPGRTPGMPHLRGVSRVLANLLGESPNWPDTGVLPAAVVARATAPARSDTAPVQE
jgi:hypothetical protein